MERHREEIEELIFDEFDDEDDDFNAKCPSFEEEYEQEQVEMERGTRRRPLIMIEECDMMSSFVFATL